MRFVLLAVLLALPALAVEMIPEVSLRPARPAASEVRFGLSVATASLVSISSSVLGGVLAVSVPSWCTSHFGEPKPMCGVAGIALAGAAQLIVSLLIIPELFRISGDDPGSVRTGWWRWARWPAAVLAASVLVFFAGSASEAKNYGTGQGTMITGMGAAAASGVSVDVMGIVGAVRAAKARR